MMKIIKEIGIILGYTCVVPIIALVIPWTQNQIVILTSSVLLIVSIVFYNKCIAHRFNSVILSLFLVVIITIFVFYRDLVKLKSPYKEKIEKSNDFLGEKLNIKINESKQSIWFIGHNFHITAIDKNQLLLDKIREGVNINFLITGCKDTSLIRVISNDNNSNILSTIRRMEGAMIQLIEIKNRSENIISPNKGNFEIRILRTIPYFRGYFFDIERDDRDAYIVPYINGFYSAEVPGYLFEDFDSRSIAYGYMEALNRIWNNSELLRESDEFSILPSSKKKIIK
ncbi:MAG: hypothetical protein KAT68_05770 [Bacteroidales bacterium]|nr:hypothetical protein [Bacteroidales bacterium]